MTAPIEQPTLGWQVVDKDGNVVQSGPVVIAEMAADLRQAFGLDPEE